MQKHLFIIIYNYTPFKAIGGVLGQKLMLIWYERAARAEQNAFYRTEKALFVLKIT